MAKSLDQSSSIALTMNSVQSGGYFLKILEKDLHKIFAALQLRKIPRVKLSRMKSIASNADLSISPLSTCSELEILEELIAELNALSYISKSHLNDWKHLAIHLNKSIAFQSVLNQVTQKCSEYGIVDSTQFRSCLIILHNSHSNTSNSPRLILLTEQLICVLLFNNIKVLVSGFKSTSACMSDISPVSCFPDCSQGIEILSELIFQKSTNCDYRNCLKCQNDILINGEAFASSYPHKIQWIKISDSKSKVVRDGAHILHFARNHSIEYDAVVHICAFNDFDRIVQSSCLNNILGLTNTPDFFTGCLGVSFDASEIRTMEAYLEHSRKEISKAILDCSSSSLSSSEMLDTLLDTSVKFTFLAGRTNCALRLNVTNNENLKRDDGIFVQYNFARLSKLLETFESKVKSGHYAELPQLCQIDFNLLQEKEEWELLKFIMFYPSVVEEVYDSIFSKNGFLSNKIFQMVKNLSHLFSKYYRRVRVLTGPELQLQKVMFARIWLLKGIYQIMLNSFKMINVKGLCSM